MLRPSPSRVCITSSDIQDLKHRLAKRPIDPPNATSKGVDWFAVHAAQHSQNNRPVPYHKGLLRPGAARSRDEAFVLVDESRTPTPSSGTTEASSHFDESVIWGVPPHDPVIPDELDTHGAPTSGDIGSSSSSGIEDYGFSDLVLGSRRQDNRQQRDTDHRYGHDGANEASRPRQRGGDSLDRYDHCSLFDDDLPDEYRLPRHPRRTATERFSIAPSLDPLAPSFVPTVRFGSADDDSLPPRAPSSDNEQGPQYLRTRPSSSTNYDARPPGQVSLRVVPQTHSRASLQQPQHRANRQVIPSPPPPAIVIDRYSAVDQSSLTLPYDDALPLHSNTQSRPHSWSEQHRTMQSAGYSVPDLSNPSTRAPTIHSRNSSLTWNRGGSNGTASVDSRVGASMRATNRHSAPLDGRPFHHTGPRDPPQSFYLHNSPLDELSHGLHRFSAAAASGRHSSGGSNRMRPFHGRLLSGSLFYSEDVYSEDQQPISNFERQGSPGEHLGSNGQLPPSFSETHRWFYRHPAAGPFVQRPSSPPSPSDLPPTLRVGRVTESLNYSELSTSPADFPSPTRLSPITSGPTYSVPNSSMPLPSLSPSSAQSISSNPPSSIPQMRYASSPRRERAQSPLAYAPRVERHSRPPPTPRFRVYEDDLPAVRQPQTPADLIRRYPPRPAFPNNTSTSGSGSSSSPARNPNRNTCPPMLSIRPIFEPSTAELTAIPFLSPREASRQPRIPPQRRRGQQSLSDEQENKIDVTAIAGLEDERRAWLRRSAGASTVAGGAQALSVLNETPPREGRYERLMRD
ncbi:hypothetical protein BDV97DRAFT_369209 [Delphinella strobiligena]|nr:hypothetical protein BDV97DRAFT_369209 [Delphinella strobiligena]